MVRIKLLICMLSAWAFSFVVFPTEAKDPSLRTSKEGQSLAIPTKESLEKRIHELIDAAVRKDEKKIASMLLGGKGERRSWNRQVIWEYMAHKYSRDCKNIIIYLNGYDAYTREWCSDDQPPGPCPKRAGESRYWVFRGGQWYIAEPPFRNSEPQLREQWKKFIADNKDNLCDSKDDAIVIKMTQDFMNLVIAGKLEEAVSYVSSWCCYNSFDTSFNLSDGRIDKLCSFYQYKIVKYPQGVSYGIKEPVLYRNGDFSVDDEERVNYYVVVVEILCVDGTKREAVLWWLKEYEQFKIWIN